MHSLSMDATRVIWHQRLTRIHTKGIGRTSKVVNGLPLYCSETDPDFLMYDSPENERNCSRTRQYKKGCAESKSGTRPILVIHDAEMP